MVGDHVVGQVAAGPQDLHARSASGSSLRRAMGQCSWAIRDGLEPGLGAQTRRRRSGECGLRYRDRPRVEADYNRSTGRRWPVQIQPPGARPCPSTGSASEAPGTGPPWAPRAGPKAGSSCRRPASPPCPSGSGSPGGSAAPGSIPRPKPSGSNSNGSPASVAVGLNGSELPASVGPVVRIPIDGPIPARNTLTLDVDLGPLGAFEGDWGVVALVVGPKRGGPGIIAPGPIEGGAEGGGGG